MRSILGLGAAVAGLLTQGLPLGDLGAGCAQLEAGDISAFYRGVFKQLVDDFAVHLPVKGVARHVGEIDKLIDRARMELRDDIHGFKIDEAVKMWKETAKHLALGHWQFLDQLFAGLQKVIGKKTLSLIIKDVVAVLFSMEKVRPFVEKTGCKFSNVDEHASPNHWFEKHSVTYFKALAGNPNQVESSLAVDEDQVSVGADEVSRLRDENLRDCETVLGNIKGDIHSYFRLIADDLKPLMNLGLGLDVLVYLFRGAQLDEKRICGGRLCDTKKAFARGYALTHPDRSKPVGPSKEQEALVDISGEDVFVLDTEITEEGEGPHVQEELMEGSNNLEDLSVNKHDGSATDTPKKRSTNFSTRVFVSFLIVLA